ncbi:hypothetical protein D9757_012287 [Collybiopsis confluens]|uniref:Uncharacterized protein n=1 Tax=Collybiopsis confluens TaxID=2823264 RepID=A0A8H5GPP0_9AGAR|nr:hypothetical protein D9757_012287 [Collybiopsis confluens]
MTDKASTRSQTKNSKTSEPSKIAPLVVDQFSPTRKPKQKKKNPSTSPNPASPTLPSTSEAESIDNSNVEITSSTPVSSVAVSAIAPTPTVSTTTTATAPAPDSDSDIDMASARLNESGKIEAGAGKKGPYVKAVKGLPPEDLDDLEFFVSDYCTEQAITDETRIKDIYASAFMSSRAHAEWFKTEQTRLQKLALSKPDLNEPDGDVERPFLNALMVKLIGPDWAANIASQRDRLFMANGPPGAFSEFISTLKGFNRRLKGQGSYLSESQLLAFAANKVSPILRELLEETNVTISSQASLQLWIDSVETIENRFRHRVSAAVKPASFSFKRPGQNDHYRNGQSTKSHMPPASRSSENTSFTFGSLRSLSDVDRATQRDFLDQLQACYKCRTAFAGHRSNQCSAEAAPLKVPFQWLTKEMVANATKAHEKTKMPVSYSAIISSARSRPAVAAVYVPAPLEDIANLIDSPSPRAPPVGAFTARGIQIYDRRHGPDEYAITPPRSRARTPPRSPKNGRHYDNIKSPLFRTASAPPERRHVAALVPFSDRHLTADNRDDDDSSESGEGTDNAGSVSSSQMPFFVPHFLWRALISGPALSDPLPLTVMIDDGCPFVLIRADVVTRLGLKRKRLRNPQQMSLAMSSGVDEVFSAYEYYSFPISDYTSAWTSRHVRALIVPSLCDPILLGLPFLSHNNLVADYGARTLIHKPSGFDLLNPLKPVLAVVFPLELLCGSSTSSRQ